MLSFNHNEEKMMKDGFLCVSTDVSPVSGITVLLSLTVFMLLVAEIMPATSDSVPLIGKENFHPSVSLQGNRSLYSPPSFHGNWQTVGSFIHLFFAQKGRKGSASCLDSGMKSVEINIKHCWSLFSRCHASDTAPRKFEINSSLGKSCRCRMRRVKKKRKTCRSGGHTDKAASHEAGWGDAARCHLASLWCKASRLSTCAWGRILTVF